MSFITSIPLDYESLKIVSNIFIAFIGSGVLGLPYAFKRSGLLEGAFVMAIVAYFSTRAMLLLIDCQYKVKSVLQGRSSFEMNGNSRTATKEADSNQTQHDKPNGFGDVFTGVTVSRDKTDAIRQREPFPEKDDSPEGSESEEDPFVKVESNRRLISNGDSNGTKKSKTSSNRLNTNQEIITYSDVAFAAWGDIGRFVIDGSLICAQVGFCCGYLIFITENLSNYFTAVTKTSWLVFLLPPLFFLTLIPDLRKLAIFSLMAQVSNLMAFAVVYWFDFEHLHLASVANRKEISLKGFPFFFCVAVYCFEGAGMVIALEQSVPTDRRKQFKKYFVATIVCITALYISFGASGYLSFGPETGDIITLNLLSEESTGIINFALMVKMFLCISLFFSYPIMMFPVTRMLQRKCIGFSPTTTNQNPQSTLKMLPMFIRFILVTLSGLIVCLVPNFSTLMNIIGAVFGTLLAFIMPGLCHYAIFRNNINRADVIMDYALIIIGCLGCVLGVIEALYGETPDMLDPINSDKSQIHNIIQNIPAKVAASTNISDISPLASHSIINDNVIKISDKISETLANSISNVSSIISDKMSSAVDKIDPVAASKVLSESIS